MFKQIIKVLFFAFLVIQNTSINCDDSDFQDVSSEYAYSLAQKYGTSIRFVDLKAEQPDMQQYKWAHTSYTYLNTHLEDPNKPPSTGQGEYFEQWFDNAGSLEQQTVFTREQVSENTFSLQFTEGFKYGMSAEASFNLFDSVGMKFTMNFEINISSTQTVTKKETKTWTVQQTIKIPPKKSMVVKFIIQEDQYQDFWIDSEVQLDGFVGVWFNDRIDLNNDPQHQTDRHNLWFIPVENVVNEVHKKNYYFTDQGKAAYLARGKIEGTRGIKSYVTVEEHDLRSSNLKFLE